MIGDLDHREIEYRDGVRWTPGHVARLIDISGIDPIEFTYEEAVERTNEALLRQRLNAAQEKIVRRHFTEHR